MKVGDDGAQANAIRMSNIDMQADRRKHEPLEGQVGIGRRWTLEEVDRSAARSDHIAGDGASRRD